MARSMRRGRKALPKPSVDQPTTSTRYRLEVGPTDELQPAALTCLNVDQSSGGSLNNTHRTVRHYTG